MNRPRKSIAELLAERQAAASEAKPAEPIVETPAEPAPDPEPITILIVPAAPPADAGRPTISPEAKARAPLLPPRPFNPIPSNDVCGARTRAGTPCQSRALYRSGRCKNHGGMSTGPKSAEGKARVARNGTMPKGRKANPVGTTENLGSDLIKPDIAVEEC